MSRATTKPDLVIAANGHFGKLCNLTDSMSDEQQNAAFGSAMAAAGKEAHWGRDRNVRDVPVHLSFTNDELFARKSFAWTGTSTLGAYCVSATSSHYEWAIKKLKMHIKTGNK
jgi:hypothetical protein